MSCTTLTYRGIVHQKPVREDGEKNLVRVHDSARHVYRGAVYHYEPKVSSREATSA